jgi:hypothetical protein
MTRKGWLAAVAVVAGLAGSARADVVGTFIGTDPSQTVNVSGTNTSGTRAFQSPVGTFNFVLSNDGGLGLGNTLRSFCADYFQDVAVGNTYTYTPVAFTALPDIAGDSVKARKVQQLFDRFYDSVTDARTGAAFQLALWETLYDPTNTNLADGNFTASGPGSPTGVTTAQSWLNNISDPTVPDAAKKYDLTGLVSGSFQDQIFARRIDTPNPVPAPAGVVLLLVGAAGFIARRKLAAKKDAEPTTEEAAA